MNWYYRVIGEVLHYTGWVLFHAVNYVLLGLDRLADLVFGEQDR